MRLELLKGIVSHSMSMDTIGVYGHEIDGEKELAARYADAAFDWILGEKKSKWVWDKRKKPENAVFSGFYMWYEWRYRTF